MTTWLETAVCPGQCRKIESISSYAEVKKAMSRSVAPCWLTAAALFATADLSHPEEHSIPETYCPEDKADVVVEAHRFTDGRSFSFMVTNNGTSPAYVVQIGRGGGRERGFVKNAFSTRPISMGSPRGWKGGHVRGQDPRQPGSHSPTLISYLWTAEDPESVIQPGSSLSGFSVQLPTPEEAEDARVRFWKSQGFPAERRDPQKTRRTAQPDLTNVPFRISLSGDVCIVIGRVGRDQERP